MEEIDSLQVGSLVKSLKGRDKDRVYFVLNKVNDTYVNLVDGNFKKLVNPKLKKIKHIRLMNITLEKIASKLKSNNKVFDSEIYSAIKKELEQAEKRLPGGDIIG